MARADRRWNHNTHYYPLVLAAVPDGCRRALDVGCGEGMLARELAARVPQVVGIDKHEPSIALAREQGPAGRVEYVLGTSSSTRSRPRRSAWSAAWPRCTTWIRRRR
jgi:2-polyprenyl-3-methyl-5-hydroxy-6-metoxy-1,4-benzoquinol methylase